MATFDQRESGLWQAKIRRKGWPVQSKTFIKRADAERWARDVEVEMDKGAFVSSSTAESMTFKALADAYAAEFAPHHYRGQAWRYKLDALVSRLGRYSLVAITAPAVASYRDARLKDHDPRYTKSPAAAPLISGATVKTELDILSKVLDWAQKERGIYLPAGNPISCVRKPAAGKARDRRLSAVEWAALEQACQDSKNPWLVPALALAVETGMRQGELLALLWKDIDEKRCIAMLHMTKNGDARAVPLTSRAMQVMSGMPRSIDGRVVPQGRMTLYKAFESAVLRAGISDYTWHDLRHEALSRLAERGDLSVLELSAISGHKTLQMLKRYTHLQAENLARKLG